MTHVRTLLALPLMLALAGPLAAQESGGFVVRLGVDTTSAERFTRTVARVEVDQVGRAPRTLRRHFVYEFERDALSHLSMVVTPPGSTTPTQTIEARFDADSMRMQVVGGGATRDVRIGLQPGIVIVASSSPWVMYERQTMRLAKLKADTLRAPMYFLGAPATGWLRVSRLGRDSVVIQTDHADVFHARVDREGHLLGVRPISGTGKFGAERVPNLDLDALAAGFVAREHESGAMGALSPRDTVRVADAGGASLWIDYGRPARRGRTIFGDVVPWGEVWRTGANAATQFRTDRALEMKGTVVPAGFYTLWTLPSPSGWKLIINGETGQWGTEHKAAKDLYTIDMEVSRLPGPVERFTIGIVPGPKGGVLNLDWDTTQASVPFTVSP